MSRWMRYSLFVGLLLASTSLSAQIIGTVTSAGFPVSGVQVCFYDLGRTQQECASTGANGNYSSIDLPLGDYYVAVESQPGWLGELYQDVSLLGPGDPFSSATAVTVFVGANTTADFEIEPGYTISGQILDSQTLDPVPSSGICVSEVSGTGTGGCWGVDVGGNFATAELPAGSYTVTTYSPDEYLDQYFDAIPTIGEADQFSLSTPVTLGPASATSVDFQLDTGATISGQVTAEAGGAAIAEATVCIIFSSNRFATCTNTSANGGYTSEGLPPGDYVVQIGDGSAPGFLGEYYDQIPEFGDGDQFAAATRISVDANDITGIDFSLLAGNNISGVVVAASGAPLADVTVCVTESAGLFGTCAQTNQSGAYTSNALPQGDYIVEVSGFSVPGFLGEYYNNQQQSTPGVNFDSADRINISTENVVDVDFVLDPGATISGTLTVEGSSTPVSNASVCVYRSTDRGFVTCTGTDALGVYTTVALPPGSYILESSNTQGLVREYYDNVTGADNPDPFSAATPVVVAASNVTGIDFALSSGFSVSGNVVDQATLQPLSGIRVCVYVDSGSYGECALTDPNGDYTADGLPAGQYRLEVDSYSLSAYVPQYYDGVDVYGVPDPFGDATLVSVGPSDVSGINFALTSGNTISGRVYDEVTGEGVAFGSVCFESTTFGSSCTGVDDGTYTSPGLAPGSYRVRVYPPAGYIDEYYDDIATVGPLDPLSLATVVDVTAGSVPNVDFALSTGSSVFGRVVTDGSGAEPIFNVSVCAYLIATRQYGECTNTDFNGDYTIEGLPDGDWAIQVDTFSVPGYLNETYNNVSPFDTPDPIASATPVTVSGGPVSGIDFALAPGFTISGSVLEEGTNSQIAGSSVCIYQDDRTFVSCTSVDAAGNFTSTSLPPGEYVLQAYGGTFFSEYYDNVSQFFGDRFDDADRVTVTDASVTGIDFLLGAGNTISGLVTAAADGEPIADAQVCVYSQAETNLGCFVTDVAGAWTSTPLPADDYLVGINTADGFIREYYDDLSVEEFALRNSTPISVGPADATDVNIALDRATVIELTWQARVTGTSAQPGTPGFGVAAGDLISGRVVYDSAATGVPGASGTQYPGSVVTSEALLNGQLLVGGSDGNFIRLNNQPAGSADAVSINGGDGIGTFGGSGIVASINLNFSDGVDALDDELLGTDAPSLVDFAGAAVSISGYPTGSLVGVSAELLSVQSMPLRNDDRDGDGISNAIENALGLNPDDPADASADRDGDGVSNLGEVQGSSDPDDATSVPQVGFLRFRSGSVNVDEGDPFIPVDVVRFAGNAGAVSARVVVGAETAIEGTHYTAPDPLTATVSWADGESGPRRVNVPVLDTPGFDITRSVNLQLVDPTGGIEIAMDSAAAFIHSNTLDAQGIAFGGFIDQVRYDVRAEEDSGELNVLLNRRGSSSGRVAIDYSLNVFAGTTTLPALTGSLVWEDGDASLKSLRIPLYDNADSTRDLDFQLLRNNLGGDAYKGLPDGVFTIEDEETLLRPQDSVGFAVRGERVFEDDGIVTIPLLRTGKDTSQPLSVEVILLDGPPPLYATPGDDFDGVAFPQTVTWGAADTAVKNVQLEIFNDTVSEDIEIFIPYIIDGNTLNREILSIGRIFDDGDYDPTLDSDQDGIPDIGDIDNDNDGVPNTVDAFPFDPAESSDTDFDGIGDNTDTDIDGDGIGDAIETLLGLDPGDPADAFTADSDLDTFSDLREVAAGSDPGDAASVPGPGFIELSDLNVIVSEDGGFAQLSVERVRGDVGTAEVRIVTEDVTAVAGVDYSPVDQPVFFSDNDSFPRTISIPIFDNASADGYRTIRVRALASGATPQDQIMVSETLVVIVDDDIDAQGAPFAGLVSVRYADLRVRESMNVAEIWVERIGSSEGELKASYEVSGDTAIPGVDFVAVSGEVSWTDGESAAKSILVPLIDDLIPEVTETFDVTFAVTQGPGGTIFENTYVQIVDDELAYLPDVISASQLEPTVGETEGTIELSFFRLGAGASGAEVVIDFSDLEAENAPSGDYNTLTPQQLSWAAGETGRRTIVVPVLDDEDFEDSENFEVNVSPGSGSALIDDAAVSVAIVDLEDIDREFDADNDGLADFADLDDDNDGVNDFVDAFPNDASRAGDRDGDGVDDLDDAFPDDPTLQSDAIVTVTEIDKLTASDGEAGDLFGSSIAIDGGTAIIGAAGDSVSGIANAGSAYVFERRSGADPCPVTGANDSWCEVQKLTASDVGEGHRFGTSTLEGDTAVVTAFGVPDGLFRGAAYVFERNDGSTACVSSTPIGDWCETAKLAPSSLSDGDQFGLRDAGLSGNTIAVGVERDDALGQDAGAVFLFERNLSSDVCPATGSVEAWCENKIFAADGSADDRFGHSVSLDGDTLFVSADRDGDNGERSGSTYVFTRNNLAENCPFTGTPDPWCQRLKLLAADGMPFDQFGRRLVLRGDTAVIGAPVVGNEGAGFPAGRGAAYVFRNFGNDNWQQVDKLEPRGGASAGDIFGYPSFDGATMVIGSPSDDVGVSNTGSAYVFVDTGGLWQQQAKLSASDAAEGDLFADGNTAVSGTTILVGAASDDDRGADSGSVYVFNTAPVDGDGDGIVDTVDPDDDNDGIGDRIENQFAFLNRADPNDADLDFDLDGVSNLRELVAGYRPDDSTSVPGAGSITLNSALISREETAAFVPIEVRRLRGDVGTVSVVLETFDGPDLGPGTNTPTAVAGVDYVATSQVLTWGPEERGTQIVNVPLLQTAERRSGLFGVRLVPVAGEQILRDELRVLVQESDIEATGLDYAGSIVNGNFSTIASDSSGEVTVYVYRNGGDDSTVSVDYEFVGNTEGGANAAVEGVDFLPSAGTLTWAGADRAPKPVSVTLIDTANVALTRALLLDLSNASANAELTPYRQGIQIVDDELVQFNTVTSTAFFTYHDETDPVAKVRYLRTGDGVGEVQLVTGFAPTSTATAGADFVGDPITVTWPDGVTGIQEVALPLLDDNFVDNPTLFETVVYSFTSLTPGTGYFHWFLPVPIVFDYEDRDLVTDSDNDGAIDVFDRDDDNDLIADSVDPTPRGEPLGTGLQDVFTSEDATTVLVDLDQAFTPQPYVDQQQLDADGLNQAVRLDRTVAQSFTTSSAGILEAIELSGFAQGSGGPLTLEVLDFTFGDLATASSFGSVTIDAADFGPAPDSLSASAVTATLIDLSQLDVKVVPGSQIAIRLSSDRPLPNLFAVKTTPLDVYPGGDFFVDDAVQTGTDLSFKLSLLTTVGPNTYSIAGISNPDLFENIGISGSSLSFTPAENQSGSTSVTVQALSDSGDVSSDTFDVVVDAVVDAPVLAVTPQVGLAGLPVPLNIDASLLDTDGSESLSLIVDSVPVEYALSAGTEQSPGQWQVPGVSIVGLNLQPISAFAGSFELFVTARATESATGDNAETFDSFTVTIEAVTDVEPAAVADDLGSVPVGSTTTGLDVLGNDANLLNTPITVAISTPPGLGSVTVAAGNTITYVAPTDAAGEDSFAYTVTDAEGDTSTASVAIFVNDVPVAVDDEVEATLNTSVDFDVLGNDGGLLNGLAGIAILTQPANGTLLVNGDNSITYTPDTGFAGSDSAQYQITDGDGESAVATVALFSDAFPIADPDDGGSTVIGNPILGIDVLQNDVLGNGVTELTVELTPNSTVAVNVDDPLNPLLDYLPNSGFSGEDTFFYRITDEDGDFSIGQVNVQVSSASGIPGQNFNVVGPTPDDPLYVPDTGLRQQNEVQCAFQSDNLMRVMCAYNDWRNVEANLDGHIGISQTRDGNSWFSRLAPHHNQYEETLGLASSSNIDLDLGFSADPVIASVPGGMITGFIASFRDEDLRGTGGLYMQRWYEQNSEIGFPFEPQRELVTVSEGAPGRFIDKDHMIFTLNQTSSSDLVAVSGTRERVTADGDSQIDRLWPAGEVTFVYSEFNGSDGEIINFEDDDYPGDAPLANADWTVSGDAAAVTIESAPLLTSKSLTIRHAENAGDLPNVATLTNILPEAANRGARILFDVFLTAADASTAGTYRFVTPYGVISYGNGVIGVLGQPDQLVETAGKFLQIEMFADPSPADTASARFSIKVTDIAQTDPALAVVAQFNDVPIVAVPVASDISVSSDVPPTAETALATTLYVEALGVQIATDSDIVVKQTTDFGETWGPEYQLTPENEGTAAHQGAYLAEFGGTMLAVWRRIDDPLTTDPNQSDAIMFAFADDRGNDWSGVVGQPMVWQNADGQFDSEICPFDQSTGKDRFRTLTFPVAVASSDGFLVFWADRKYAGGSCDAGASRVVMSRYLGGGTWSQPVPVDPIPAEDPGSLGHQFMPAAAVAQDQIQVAWYDSRNDESRSFTNEIFDATSTDSEDRRLYVRHTLDVRSVRLVGAVPVGPSIQVTQFKQGILPDESGGISELVQLERFYANGRIFRQGDSPFLGDYIGVATKDHRYLAAEQRWVSNKTFDPVSPEEPQFLVSWADNRDVLGDVWEDLNEATDYEPSVAVDDMIAAARQRSEDGPAAEQAAESDESAMVAEALTAERADAPSTATADALPDSAAADSTCVVGADNPFAGQTRNQNIYAAIIRPGLQLSVPTPSKNLGGFQRGFVLYLQNFTSSPRDYLISIEGQPDGGRASFRQVEGDAEPPQVTLEVRVPARSSTARTVYVKTASGDPSIDQTVPVLVEEQGACEFPETDECQRQEVLLNASPLANEFGNDGLEGGLASVSTDDAEVSVPIIADPIVTPGLQFPGLQFPGLQFPGLQFPGLQFPGLQFPGLQFPGLQFNPDNPGLQFPGLQFPGLQFPGLQFPGLQFPGLQFPGLQFDPESDAPRPVDFSESGAVVAAPGGTQDATQNAELVGVIDGLEMTEIVWPVSNGGNVLNSFNLEPFVAADITNSPSQLLVVRTYVSNTVIKCELQPKIQQDVIVNIANPDLDGEDSGVQVFIAPGETLLVILRVWQEPVPAGQEPEMFSVVEEGNSSIAVVAASCDSDTAGDTCDPESQDPEMMPPAVVVGDHPMEADFLGVSGDVLDVSATRLRSDRVTRKAYSDITVTNVSTSPIIGRLRLALNSNKSPLNSEGETDEATPRPFLDALKSNNSVLAAGESVTVRVFFSASRPRASFSVEPLLKSVTPP